MMAKMFTMMLPQHYRDCFMLTMIKLKELMMHRPSTYTHRLNIVAATALEIGLALGHTEVGLDS